MSDWKSTASSILTGLIGTLNGVMAFQIPVALMNPQLTHTWLWVTVACNVGSIVGKVWLGVITKNADARAVAAAINSEPSTVQCVSPAELTAAPKP